MVLKGEAPVKLEIKSLVGERVVTSEDGQQVYERIHPELVAGNGVCLDFTGVTVFASPFFNSAVGQLLQDLRTAELNRLLDVKGLAPDGRLVWHRVVRNAKDYWHNPEKRKAIDEILSKQAEDE